MGKQKTTNKKTNKEKKKGIKRRGRPIGSKNKPKKLSEISNTIQTQTGEYSLRLRNSKKKNNITESTQNKDKENMSPILNRRHNIASYNDHEMEEEYDQEDEEYDRRYEDEEEEDEMHALPQEILTDAQVNGVWSSSSESDEENTASKNNKQEPIDSYINFLGEEEKDGITYFKYKCLLCQSEKKKEKVSKTQ